MNSSGKPLVFGGGVPTAPDVKRLVEKFGVPALGTVIGYDDIAAVIGSPHRSSRWSSVVGAWRKQLERENNVLLIAEPGKGLYAADPHERVHEASSRYKHGIKQISKAGRRAGSIESAELNAEELRARDHIVGAAAALRMAAAMEARKLKALTQPSEKK